MRELVDKARRAGFKVYEKHVEYTALSGETIEEQRLVAYNERERTKLSYNKRSSGGDLYIVITGAKATRSMAEKIESLGGSVDLDEGKRLFAVIKRVEASKAGEIVERLFKHRGS